MKDLVIVGTNSRDPKLCLIGMWRLNREEIEERLEKKEIEFSTSEKKNSRYGAKQWLHKYIHSDLHEVLFVEFPIILVERLLSPCETN